MTSTALDRFSVEGGRAIADRDWDAYGELFSENLAMRAPGIAGTAVGRHVRVAMAQGIMDAFPDGTVTVERAFESGDVACLQVVFKGTHTGPLATPNGGEIPPSGSRVAFPYCMVVRFHDDRAVELDEYYDQLDLLAQIGVPA